jgi:hypothetical protein
MSSLAHEVSPETLRGAEEDLTTEGLAALDRRAGSIAGLMHPGPAAVSRSARRQRRDRWTPGAAFCRHGSRRRLAEPGEATIQVTIEAELLLAAPRP